jgi:hypothetical protein
VQQREGLCLVLEGLNKLKVKQMKEMSNSTLALLVVVAMVVSAGGTFLSLSRISHLGEKGELTAFLTYNITQYGRANLSVPSLAYINATDNTINLGLLGPGEWNSSDRVGDYWNVTNEGSVNVSIQIYAHAADPQWTAWAGIGPFTVTAVNNQTGSCSNAVNMSKNGCFRVYCKDSTYSDATCDTAEGSINSSTDGDLGRYLVMNLSNTLGNNSVRFGANISIPFSQPSGDYDQYVEFKAVKSSCNGC